MVFRDSQKDEPFLYRRVTRISHNPAQGIAKDSGRLLERHFVFGENYRRFLRVPLEL